MLDYFYSDVRFAKINQNIFCGSGRKLIDSLLPLRRLNQKMRCDQGIISTQTGLLWLIKHQMFSKNVATFFSYYSPKLRTVDVMLFFSYNQQIHLFVHVGFPIVLICSSLYHKNNPTRRVTLLGIKLFCHRSR